MVIDIQEKLLPPIFEKERIVPNSALQELTRLRNLYEPYALSLAGYLKLDLPPWIKGVVAKDNWQTTAWQLSQAQQQAIPAHDEHQ